MKPRSQIKVYGKNLYIEINKIKLQVLNLYDINIFNLSKKIGLKLNINYDSILKTLNERNSSKFVSISIIYELLIMLKEKKNMSNEDFEFLLFSFQDNFELFTSNSCKQNKIKLPNKLNSVVAKIMGAHIADGNLFKEITKGGVSYKIQIIDHYKINLIKFSEWINNLFNLNCDVFKAKSNAWSCSIRNKVLGRFFEIYFDFPCGNKTYFNMPMIIKNSSLEIKKEFVLGALTFDGCVELDRSISYGIRNRVLRDEIGEIIKEYGLNIKFQSKSGNHFIRSPILKDLEFKEWLIFFEEGSEKWIKIKVMSSNLTHKVQTYDEAMDCLNMLSHKESSSKVTLFDVLNKLKELKICDKYILAKELNIAVSTLYRYLHILRRTNILITGNDIVFKDFINLHNKFSRILLTNYSNKKLFSFIEKNNFRRELILKFGISNTTYRNWKFQRTKIPIYVLKYMIERYNFENNVLKVVSTNRIIFKYNEDISSWVLPSEILFA